MTKPAGLSAFQLSFQISPIIFTGGIAQLIPGGMLPIIAITQALNFADGLLGGSDTTDLDKYFAQFRVLPGGKMANNQYGQYPFANQQVAANATIAEGLNVSLLMTCPAGPPSGFSGKLAILTALKAAVNQHTNMGGTFIVATPSFFLTNALLLDITDVTPGQPSQPQAAWQWNFWQPLLTEEQAAIAYNGMMNNLVQGLPSTGALSGPEVTGAPLSLAAPSLIPAASTTAATGVGVYQ